MGKNFSCNNVSGQRKASDFYETPYSLTRQLLEVETIPGNILEPACGNGAIVKVLEENGYPRGCNVIESYDISEGTDFLEETHHYDSIITNPPFSIANEFIIHAKKISDRIVFLLPWSYIHGKERYDTIYTDKVFPLSRVYCFTRYPMLGENIVESGQYRTGMMVYGWFIFERGCEHEPFIRWIDNDEFVVGNKEARRLGII